MERSWPELGGEDDDDDDDFLIESGFSFSLFMSAASKPAPRPSSSGSIDCRSARLGGPSPILPVRFHLATEADAFVVVPCVV